MKEGRLERGFAGAVLAWLGLAHLWVVSEAPLVRYGYRGAEYLEHIQRQYAIELTAGQSWWERVWRLPEALGLLDGQYPALLHVLAAGWGKVAGGGLEATVHLNLLFMAVLALGTGLTAYRLAGWEEGDRRAEEGDRRAEEAGRESRMNAAILAAVAVLVMPAVFATARRYYYDLPVAAWCSLATAGLLYAHRSWRSALLAGVATAAACLTKWQALLYLAPAWGWALGAASGLFDASRAGSLANRRIGESGGGAPGETAQAAGERAGESAGGAGARSAGGPGETWAGGRPKKVAVRPSRAAALIRLGMAGMLTALLCWPVARRSDVLGEWASRLSPSLAGWLHLSIQQRHGSLDDALGQGARALAGSGGVLERLGFYLRALVASSVGPWLCGALGIAALLGRRWRSLAFALWLALPPVLVLAVAVRVEDERFLLPVLPALAASASVGWAGIRRRGRARVLWFLILGLGLMQMWAVDDLLSGLPGPRSPVQMRGWNRRHEASISPWQSYLTLAEAACPAQSRPAKIWLAGELGGVDADLHAWRWALSRACPGIETSIGNPDDGSKKECQAFLSTSQLVGPAWVEVLSARIPGGHPEQMWLYRRPSCP